MTSRKQVDILPVNIFFNKAVQAGFPYESLPRLLQYTMTATGLNVYFVKRVKFHTEPPVNILYAGVLGLPIVRGLGISRAMAEDPNTCMTCAYRISNRGTGFGYLPPLDNDLLVDNRALAQGYYAIWLNSVRHHTEWD